MRRVLFGSCIVLLGLLVALSVFGSKVDAVSLYGGERLDCAPDLDEAVRIRREEWLRNLRPALLGQLDFDPATSGVEISRELRARAAVSRSKQSNAGVEVTFSSEDDAIRLCAQESLWRVAAGELDVELRRDRHMVEAQFRPAAVARIHDDALRSTAAVLNRRCAAMGLRTCATLEAVGLLTLRLPFLPGRQSQLPVYREILLSRGRVEFKLLDDEADLLADIRKATSSEALPAGISTSSETVPVGGDRTAQASILEFHCDTDEPGRTAYLRWRQWCAQLSLRHDHEVALGISKEADPSRISERYDACAWRSYYLIDVAELTGADVTAAVAGPNPTDKSRSQVISVTFSQTGADRFKRLTAYNVGRRFAILMDGWVETVPVVQSEIPNGHAEITMGQGQLVQQEQDAKRLAILLTAGELTAPLQVTQEAREVPRPAAVWTALALSGGLGVAVLSCFGALLALLVRRLRTRSRIT